MPAHRSGRLGASQFADAGMSRMQAEVDDTHRCRHFVAAGLAARRQLTLREDPAILPRGRVPLPVGRAGFKPVGGRVGVFGRFDSCLFRFSRPFLSLRIASLNCERRHKSIGYCQYTPYDRLDNLRPPSAKFRERFVGTGWRNRRCLASSIGSARPPLTTLRRGCTPTAGALPARQCQGRAVVDFPLYA